MTDKLHKGRITDWGRVFAKAHGGTGLGYAIAGKLDGSDVLTTSVVARVFDEATGNTEIETRNSCYTLVGAEGLRAP